MSNVLSAKLLAYLRLSNEIAQRFQKQAEKRAAERAVAQAKLDEAVKACVAHERIFPEDAKAVTVKLASDDGGYVAALELIRDLAAHRNAAELATIGTVRTEKKASAPAPTSSRVIDYDDCDEGRAFRQRLLG